MKGLVSLLEGQCCNGGLSIRLRSSCSISLSRREPVVKGSPAGTCLASFSATMAVPVYGHCTKTGVAEDRGWLMSPSQAILSIQFNVSAKGMLCGGH